MSRTETVVFAWASDTCRGADATLAIVTFLRKRRDVPVEFANKAMMLGYLVKTGGVPENGLDIDDVWASYVAYRARMNGSQETLPASRAEARRLGATRFAGLVCPLDPSHGNTRAVSGGVCVVCRGHRAKDYHKTARQMRRDPYYACAEVEPLTEAEIAMAKAALATSRRRVA